MINSFTGKNSGLPDCKNSNILTFSQLSSFSYGDFPEGFFPVGAFTGTTGVPDRDGVFNLTELGGVHQVTQIRFVHGSSYNHVRHRSHICNIEDTMMGWSVLTDKSSTVEAEDYRQVLNCNIMDNLVVRSLHKCGV